ncbi:MAG: 50S ribosomal protein L6 [Patescibacteria group bacterium]
MSRIGKKTIKIPAGVTVTHEAGLLSVKGPKGTNERSFPKALTIAIEGGEIKIGLAPVKRESEMSPLWGTYAAHLNNMILGVTTGFEKKLMIEGIGYKAAVTGENLTLNVGFSHPVVLAIPKGLKVAVDKGQMSIAGIDREVVGQFAAVIRAVRPPDAYKEKGLRYADEVVIRKQGKKVVA